MVNLAAELTLPRWAVKIWWKAHERDSEIAPQDVKGSPQSYPYGKVTGLTPALWSDGNHSTTVTRWGAPVVEDTDMPINATENLRTDFRADVPAGLDWYEDANLDRRGGSFGSASNVTYVGQPVGESVEGGSRAILINTGNLYPDGPRPTIVYVAAGAITPYRDPQPTTPPDVDEALAMRDQEWTEWMLDGSPGSEA